MNAKKRMRKSMKTSLFCLMLFLLLSMTAAASEKWGISENTEIYWVQTNDSMIDDSELKAQIQLFAQEMQAKGISKTQMKISYGEETLAEEGDIVLYLDSSLDYAEEGYCIDIKEGQLWVKASDADGLFYGCRAVEKILLSGENISSIAGEIIQPDYPERAFFLDCGRKYYDPEWIKDMIREISWSDMNAIYFHFSEEMGFRLESKTYPWLAGGDHTLCIGGAAYGVSEDDGKYITQDEMRQIAEVAKLYHVEIIPSLDSPGHMNYAVKKYKEQYGTDIGNYYHYNGKTAIVQGSGPEAAQKNYSRGIDISNEEAITFAKNLYAEYAAFFKELGCTKFDIGGDELLGWGTSIASGTSKWQQLDHWKTYAQKRSGNSKAVAYDAFMYYMNDIYDLVKEYDYTSIRMWNDDALRTADTGWNQVVTLNPDMEIQYWTESANSSKNNVWTYLNKGFKVYNFLNSYNYYVLGQVHDGSDGYKGITPQHIYENWAPNVFISYEGKTGSNTAIGNTNVKGSAFCVWCDKPSTETAETVKQGILPSIRMNGVKAWDADINETVTFNNIQSFMDKIGNVPSELPEKPEIEERTLLDYKKLNDAIAAFEKVVKQEYTEETYKACEVYAEYACGLKKDPNAIQENVDAAAERLTYLLQELRPITKVASGDDWVLSLAVKAKSVCKGKIFTFVVYTAAESDVTAFEMYDEDGNRVEWKDIRWSNTAYTKKDKYGAQIRVTADVRGEHTYTIYAVNRAGYRSPDSRSITVTVK